jgi:NAD(P)-dependent dehydrogenase (short-subunit alcohol dehydrogenase family)
MAEWQVKDQVIVITGGSRGIGFGAAQLLAQRGAKLALLARDQAVLSAAVKQLGEQVAIGIRADACNAKEVEQALRQVVDHFGQIDGLINNVGYQFARRVELMPEAEVRQLVDSNFLSAVFGCQAVIPHLRRAGGGRIVNISSSSVRHVNEFCHLALYSASKAALEKFSAALRDEVRVDGIAVTVISSGAVLTGSVANFDPVALGEAMQAWLQKGPMTDGFMNVEPVAHAIAHAFEYPPGVALEFLEVRPNAPVPKMLESSQS